MTKSRPNKWLYKLDEEREEQRAARVWLDGLRLRLKCDVSLDADDTLVIAPPPSDYTDRDIEMLRELKPRIVAILKAEAAAREPVTLA